jgi:cytochrome P450 family 110
MDLPTTSDGGRQETAAAAGCPVDHGAGAAAPVERTTIHATELPGSKLPAIVQLLNYWTRPQSFVEKRRKRYGPRFQVSIRLPARPVYMLTEPEDVKAMFLAPGDVLHTGTGSATIEKWTGTSGLAWLDEDAHARRRKLVMPSYHGAALRRISEVVPQMAKEDVASWPRGEVMALHPHILRFTLHVIREVIYGPRTPKRWEELLDVIQQMMEFNNSIASPMMIHKMPPKAVERAKSIKRLGLKQFLENRERADAMIYETIEEHRESGHRGDDLLSVLLGITHDDGSPLSLQEIRDEMMTIFLAGTETTAAAIAWSFEYLSRHDEARARLLAEIDAGESDAYLTATINEVLRLRPSIPNIIVRHVVKPIEIGGVRYDPGMDLWASSYLVNRDRKVYSDPDAFRPERFLDSKPGTYTWIPFGGGRIRCLGDKIALVEMKAMIREVLTQCVLHRPDSKPERARSRIVVNVPSKFTLVELRDRARESSMA